jgi:hypothetical protein
MKLVYICSPFTYKLQPHQNSQVKFVNEQKRFDRITAIAAKLTYKYRAQYAFDLPITSSYMLELYEPRLHGDFEFWADRDLFMVREKAEEVWVVTMSGWRKSVGVTAEIACAKKHGKKIRYVDPKTLKITAREPKVPA